MLSFFLNLSLPSSCRKTCTTFQDLCIIPGIPEVLGSPYPLSNELRRSKSFWPSSFPLFPCMDLRLIMGTLQSRFLCSWHTPRCTCSSIWITSHYQGSVCSEISSQEFTRIFRGKLWCITGYDDSIQKGIC